MLIRMQGAVSLGFNYHYLPSILGKIFIARSPLDLCHWSMVGKVNERKQGRDSILWKIIRVWDTAINCHCYSARRNIMLIRMQGAVSLGFNYHYLPLEDHQAGQPQIEPLPRMLGR
jgi:hypothetical protein